MSAPSAPKEYLAKPSGLCCLSGSLHEGDERGKIETISGLETYVATPKDGAANGNIILYFPDVYGLFKNGRLIMDTFADAGYLALGVDYFRGDPVTKHRDQDNKPLPGFDFKAWLDKHMTFALNAVPGWFDAVKERYGKADTKYTCVGYCFGAPFVCNELAGTTVSAGAFAHPAFLEKHHFSNLKSPLLLSCAETDSTFGKDSRHEAEEIMKSEKKVYQFQLFSGVVHGFALRCNLDDPYERFIKEQSLKGMIEWFDFWLSQT